MTAKELKKELEHLDENSEISIQINRNKTPLIVKALVEALAVNNKEIIIVGIEGESI